MGPMPKLPTIVLHRNKSGVIYKVKAGDFVIYNVRAVKLEEEVGLPSRVTVTFVGHVEFKEDG